VADLQEAIAREFVLLKVSDQVLFTGYYEPVFRASRVRTEQFRYPLYRLPPDFDRWARPHPTRAELETRDWLKGLEIAWLADPFEAFLVHVQGSARLDLGQGQVLTVGYAGKTDRPYTSVGRELVRDGKMKLEEVTLQSLQAYFRQHPHELSPTCTAIRALCFSVKPMVNLPLAVWESPLQQSALLPRTNPYFPQGRSL
jgi:membrane-bound lytic murein transglycosylase A